MANNSGDIRRIMNLVESVQEPVLIEGWVQNLKNKRLRHLGNKERAEMAGRLKKEYYKWLGQAGRQGTYEDMLRFMEARIGFTDEDIDEVLSQAMPAEKQAAPEPSEPDLGSDKKIKTGAEVDDEEAKQADELKDLGINVEPNDNKVEPREIVDDPRRYRNSDGTWDYTKVRNKLNKMQIGDKLTLGTSTFSRSVGQPEMAESIMEAGDTDVLDPRVVSAIMDRAAARINDSYLLNGPRNDSAAAAAEFTQKAMGSKAGYNLAAKLGPNHGGRKASGQYDTQEMLDVLAAVNYPKTRIQSLSSKVQKSDSVSAMSDQDMHELALIGYAFLRSRT